MSVKKNCLVKKDLIGSPIQNHRFRLFCNTTDPEDSSVTIKLFFNRMTQLRVDYKAVLNSKGQIKGILCNTSIQLCTDISIKS